MVWMTDAFRPDNGNDHHTLPRSRGGSDGGKNITTMDMRRHADYHERVAGNRDPLTVTRLIALHSVGYRGLTMDPDTLDDLFAETTQARWQRLFEDEALADNAHPHRKHLGDKADMFTFEHAGDEMRTVDRILHCMDSGAHLPWRTNRFLPNALDFFAAQSPTEAIRRLHTEKVDGHLAWVKALRSEVREDVLSLLHGRKVPYDRGVKNDLRLVLGAQRDRLERCLTRWKKQITSPEIAAA